ncbi:MAG: DNA-3-methyladenine glycosylase [Candidatus Saccharibacteria bacterium]|nr:DNA-3-methyladenine glycosylase [Candidatus Saccharibacteria bacterium]
MHQLANPQSLQEAADHLSRHDPFLAPTIARAGICDIVPHDRYYQRLVESIIGQQLSVKAASSIRNRFVELFDGVFPAPGLILEKSVEELRSVGLSGAKVRYIQDLSLQVLEKKLVFDNFDQLSNDEIIKELTAVKGVGEWTAHMFMMFSMGRLEILPVGDLGIKNGIMKLYGLKKLPTTDEIKKIAKKYHWHPYETVASWYVWHSLDNKPAGE